MLAHDALEVREPGEVEDLFLAYLVAHARVPAVVGFDEPDDAAAAIAAEGLLDVVLVVGEEMGALGGVGLGAHRDVVFPSETGFQRGVDFGGVEVTADFEELGLRGGV